MLVVPCYGMGGVLGVGGDSKIVSDVVRSFSHLLHFDPHLCSRLQRAHALAHGALDAEWLHLCELTELVMLSKEGRDDMTRNSYHFFHSDPHPFSRL